MKQIYLFLLVSVFFGDGLVAQSCLPSGINFTTQQEIDDFAVNYPGCVEILGNVLIDGITSTSITSLSGLSQLNIIGGSLLINNNDNLMNLTGLENLNTVSGAMEIYNNGNLNSLSALNNLTFVGGEALTIQINDNLDDLSGLENLSAVGGSLRLNFCNINSLSGLIGLDSIGGSLAISSVDVLTDLSGLNNLTYIGNDLRVQFNDDLNNLSGLENLTFIGGGMIFERNASLVNLSALSNVISSLEDMTIRDNAALLSLTGLENIPSVSDYINIKNNAVLNNIEALNAVDYSGINYLSIVENPNLSECSISSVCDFLYSGTTFSLYSNGFGCNNKAELMAGCLLANPCIISSNTDTLDFGYDNDIYVDDISFFNNQNVTFTDVGITPGALLSNISLGLYFILNGSSCEDEVRIRLTAPTGDMEMFLASSSCVGQTGLQYVEFPIANILLSNMSSNDWLIEFNDTDIQNTDYEYSVRFVSLNYTRTTSPTVPDSILSINGQPIPDGLYRATDEVNSTGTVPNGGSVNFKARQLILLDDGFSVETNADFSAEIEDCN